MAQVVLRDGTVIKDYAVPYIIAEINSSHNGRVETARKMIETAKEIGVSCVKFQSWSADSLYSESYYAGNPIARRIVQKFSLNEEQLGELADYCAEIGISFSSTPYSRREVDFLLERCRAPFIKIASMDINNPEYLKYIAGTGAPIILSTGMAETAEVERAVKTLEDAGNPNIILLHCISIYPAAPSTIHLNNIAGLREAFPGCPVGFSDHTLGIETACAATALGAAVIEKHFTLDKTKMGMDNNMATEPDEFARMIQCCRNVQDVFSNTCMRVYTNADIKGVELSGALKNVIALGVGISTGLGYGDNARAALITRGIAEIARLGVAMGCNIHTFAGLAGIGDLIVTATSMHSRNNRAGILIGKGKSPEQAVKEVGMVVEGINALPAAMELAAKYNVEMPIVQTVNAIVKEGMSASDALRTLMDRNRKNEMPQGYEKV